MSNVIDIEEWVKKKQEDTIRDIFGLEFWESLVNMDTLTYTFEDESGELYTIDLSDPDKV